jgi:predicted RNA-binding protein with PIN domain
MPLLIDGYNLLYVTGIVGRGLGPGSLHRSRLALLNFLAESLDPGELPRTTVVFDSHDAPRGAPRQLKHRAITVRFAATYESADELLEELIQADSAPRRLVVVSSDHRIQRAAKRRRAQAIDSDVWYAELIRARRRRQTSASDTPARPAVPLLEEDVHYWIRQFGGESTFADLLADEGGLEQNSPTRPTPDPSTPDKPASGTFEPFDNPFPPGYGQDLLDNEET